MTEFKTTDVPMEQPRSASSEVLTKAAMTHETLIQRLEHELTILRAHSERAISELKSELVAASAAYKELSAKVGTPSPASSSDTRSWKPALPETFSGKKQDPNDWFFELDCFFQVATDLSDPFAKVTFAATRLRGDALKWWRQLKTSGAAEGIDYEAFKKQLCERFLTSDPVGDARDQLAELKQTKSAKSYSSIFRSVALNVTDLSGAESLDRYIRGLKPGVKAQVKLHHPKDTEDAMRLAETYDKMVFSGKKYHSSPPGEAMEVDTISRIPKLTPELKEQLKKEGKCFRCRKPGHLSKDCKGSFPSAMKPKN